MVNLLSLEISFCEGLVFNSLVCSAYLGAAGGHAGRADG